MVRKKLTLTLIAIVIATATLSGYALADTPQVKINYVPDFSSCGPITGIATGVNPDDYLAAWVIQLPGLGWFSKPYCDTDPPYSRVCTLSSDGTFFSPLCTGGIDNCASIIEVYLIPKSSYPACYPSCILGARGVPASLVAASVASDRVLRPAQRIIEWSGRKWIVKDSSIGYVGPGQNIFSASTNTVWVDANGSLHMKISQHLPYNYWDCAEIWSQERLGYGTYRFYLDSRVDNLDPNVVLGLFTYTDFNRDSDKREIDIEFSRWGATTDPNAQYVVQPWNNAGNRYRFNMISAVTSTHTFVWQPTTINFTSIEGHGTGPIVNSWTSQSADIPPSLDERAHINLWLLDPNQGPMTEIVISKFEFEPYRDPVHHLFGINSRAAHDPLTTAVSSFYHFRLWGKVVAKDCLGFTLDDGGQNTNGVSLAVKVLDPGHTFSLGDFVAADGVLGNINPKQLDTATERIMLIK